MKVCFLSVEPIADQPRIRRQGDALHDAGYSVVAVGARGARSMQPRWPVVQLDLPRLSGRRRYAAMAAQATSLLGRRAALAAYWTDPRRRMVLRAALEQEADVYVAREWRTLPMAVRIADRTGARFAVDSPELSSEENAASRVWRTVFRPMVTAIEADGFPRAGLVTAVSDGIGAIIGERYGLSVSPTTVRNVPPYEPHEARPPGELVEVLYLGGILPERGLEQMIDSVTDWPHNWRLTIRGPGSEAYLAQLRERAAPARERVHFGDVVPLTEMVGVASKADVGMFAHQRNGPQADLALPNKLFEYMMAGLAVCVSDMPEMRAVVERAGCGVLIDAPFGAAEITRAVRALATMDLVELKRHSLAAARELNWDVESRRYVDAFASAFGPARR